MGTKIGMVKNLLKITETLTESTASQLSQEVKSLLLRLDETPENFTGRIFCCRCSTTFSVDQKTMRKNVWRMPKSQKDLEKGQWSFIVLGEHCAFKAVIHLFW